LIRQRASLVLLLIYLGLEVYLYYALKLSFPEKIPFEGIIATAFFGASTLLSIALMPFVNNAAVYALLWLATIVAWVFAAEYARTRPIPHFRDLTSLE
jgi:hypothetical protein